MISEKANIEPSMDEILTSIRQILSDPSNKEQERDMKTNGDEDILDLTQLLPDEANSVSLFKKPEGVASKPVKKNLSHPVDPQLRTGSVSLNQDDLMRLLKEQRQGPTNSSRNDPEGGEHSFEDMVREAIKPLVKEWLDAHLPSIIREISNEHIEKMVRQFVLK